MMNLIGLLGFNIEFITSTYRFKDNGIEKYANVQSMLFCSAVMYLLLGLTLEYVKSDILILILISTFGLSKVAGGWQDLWSESSEDIFDI